ncbi:sulfatase-like hydrolase/transferase [Dyadobacter pollutisoli]|uniref:Sulfatase-like hydrolase/transferase n=1 Tax=Dyadobacter pollutisoli TaxID=2910158 RepID=A0A9E8NE22_9BACT|nr:sulfatase-like hydrolase/transferase [Dyadobacter pollutisoli]WAC15040.1 sulfatase-like hydrolase/transferase [Dyadobacter pollutisoli]
MLVQKSYFKKCFLFILGIFGFISVSAQYKEPAKNEKPNVIFIMADDMGAGMLSYYGQKYFTTPNIDALAKAGVVFENSYSSGYCAPSRATLLTGYSDCRKGKYILTESGAYKETVSGKVSDQQMQQAVNKAIGKEPDVQYLPQVFKEAGYITGQVGKLDYGFTTAAKQLDHHGWDYHYGYYDHTQCHGFYPMFLHENGKRLTIPGNSLPDAGKTGESGSDSLQEKDRWDMNGKQVYSQDLFLQKILGFIRTNKDRPFFLYHPTQLPHGPVAVPSIHPELIFQNELTNIEKAYASMVKRLDDDLGVIRNELEQLDIAEKTIIIFTSDNGHELYTTFKKRVVKPYRNVKTGEAFNDITNKYYSEVGFDIFDGNHGMAGLKRSNWNGGVKVPLFVYWPKKFKKGFVSDKLVTNYDFLATMADMLHVPLKDTKDGVSYLAVLEKNGTSQEKRHESIAFASFMGPALVTDDGWKLRYYAPKKIFQLYYLPKDYKEQNDLSARYPDKVKELTMKLTQKCDGDLNNGWFSDERELRPVKL